MRYFAKRRGFKAEGTDFSLGTKTYIWVLFAMFRTTVETMFYISRKFVRCKTPQH